MDDETLYQVAVDTRKLEIQLFWQRSGYFIGLNTAIAVGYFSLDSALYGALLAALGVVVSYLWFKVNLGSKYWQSRWEQAASDLERSCAPGAKLFAASPDLIQEDVRKSLNDNNHVGLQAFLDKKILEKPSVSYRMILLSLYFVAFWGLVIGASLLSMFIASPTNG